MSVASAPPPLPGPGGTPLLARALDLADLPARGRVLDLGCGGGDAVRWMRRVRALDAVGVDLQPPGEATGRVPRARADGQRLPFPDATFDGVLLGCVLSAAEDGEEILAECARVLVAGGKLVVTDLYDRVDGGSCDDDPGPDAGFIDGQARLLRRARAHGFEDTRWEDHSAVLRDYVLRFVMEDGSVEALHARLCARGVGPRGWPMMKARRLGYALLVATRRPS